jgi:hypothetical protein
MAFFQAYIVLFLFKALKWSWRVLAARFNLNFQWLKCTGIMASHASSNMISNFLQLDVILYLTCVRVFMAKLLHCVVDGNSVCANVDAL